MVPPASAPSAHDAVRPVVCPEVIELRQTKDGSLAGVLLEVGDHRRGDLGGGGRVGQGRPWREEDLLLGEPVVGRCLSRRSGVQQATRPRPTAFTKSPPSRHFHRSRRADSNRWPIAYRAGPMNGRNCRNRPRILVIPTMRTACRSVCGRRPRRAARESTRTRSGVPSSASASVHAAWSPDRPQRVRS